METQQENEDDLIIKYILSDEFKKSFLEQVKKDTWGNGLPMIYVEDNWIIRHWEDGRKEKIKEVGSAR